MEFPWNSSARNFWTMFMDFFGTRIEFLCKWALREISVSFSWDFYCLSMEISWNFYKIVNVSPVYNWIILPSITLIGLWKEVWKKCVFREFLCPWMGSTGLPVFQINHYRFKMRIQQNRYLDGKRWCYHSLLKWSIFSVEPENQSAYRVCLIRTVSRLKQWTTNTFFRSTVHIAHDYFALLYTAWCGVLNTYSLMLSHFLCSILQQIWIHKAIYLLPQNHQGIR